MSSLKCALACSVAGNQEQRGLAAYAQLARTLNSPMDTCGGATRIQLRATRRVVKVLIPRKMETPGLAMRMGAVHVDEADQRDTHIIRLDRDVYFG